MAYRCPTCRKVFRGAKAYQRALKCCAKKRRAKNGKAIPKGKQKKVYNVKLSKGRK